MTDGPQSTPVLSVAEDIGANTTRKHIKLKQSRRKTMITINGEPFDLDTKVENEICFLRDTKASLQAELNRETKVGVNIFKRNATLAAEIDRLKALSIMDKQEIERLRFTLREGERQ
jgi:hypothetical protein